jgi:hypothetical protein
MRRKASRGLGRADGCLEKRQEHGTMIGRFHGLCLTRFWEFAAFIRILNLAALLHCTRMRMFAKMPIALKKRVIEV